MQTTKFKNWINIHRPSKEFNVQCDNGGSEPVDDEYFSKLWTSIICTGVCDRRALKHPGTFQIHPLNYLNNTQIPVSYWSPPRILHKKNWKTVQNLRKNCAQNWRANYAKTDKICAKVACMMYGCCEMCWKILIELNFGGDFLHRKNITKRNVFVKQ